MYTEEYIRNIHTHACNVYVLKGLFGTWLMFINIECVAGKYGVNCEDSCGAFCDDTNSCDHKDGTCSCTTWGIGELCDREIGKAIQYDMT